MWDIARIPFVRDLAVHLGYPSYFLVLLGCWKVLGAVALLIPRRPLLKEWAYAGAFFTYTGAIVSHLTTGYDRGEVVLLAIMTAATILSWALRPASGGSAEPRSDRSVNDRRSQRPAGRPDRGRRGPVAGHCLTSNARYRADPVPAARVAARGVGQARCPRAGWSPARWPRCWRRSGPARCCPSTARAGRPARPVRSPAGHQRRPSRRRARLVAALRAAPPEHGERRARVEAEDSGAGLRLVTEAEAVPGGAIRVRHTVTNTGGEPYVVDGLEVVFPLPGRVGEVLDFTGRQTAERIPQRHRLGDGLWLREGRRGHTGHDSATVVAGVAGFGFGSGEVSGVHVAWSGNTVHRVERVPSGLGMIGSQPGEAGPGPQQRLLPGVTTIGGGGYCCPGEITLAEGQSYTTPWVYLAASGDGLDGLAAQFHGYLRAEPEPSALAAPGRTQRVGSGLFPARVRHAGGPGGHRRQHRRGTVRSRRRLVHRPPQRPGGPGRLAG